METTIHMMMMMIIIIIDNHTATTTNNNDKDDDNDNNARPSGSSSRRPSGSRSSAAWCARAWSIMYYICIHIYIYIWVSLSLYVYIYIYMYIHVLVIIHIILILIMIWCMCVCTYIYIYIYIHIIHMHIESDSGRCAWRRASACSWAARASRASASWAPSRGAGARFNKHSFGFVRFRYYAYLMFSVFLNINDWSISLFVLRELRPHEHHREATFVFYTKRLFYKKNTNELLITRYLF